jgi:hypothetical protein
MSVKRYSVNLSVNERVDVTESLHGSLVKYHDYAALEARCAALAAENAGLKALARSWANATDDRLFEEHGEIFHDSIDACEEELKTICPTTDAFLAEVRASGVESLLTESFRADIAGALADFDGMDEASLNTLIWSGQPPEPDGDVWCVEYMTRAAAVQRKVRDFAAQLRKGVQS